LRRRDDACQARLPALNAILVVSPPAIILSPNSLDKSRIRILLLEGIDSSAAESFQEDGYSDVEYHKKPLPQAQLLASVRDAHFVGIRSATHLTEQVFEHARRLA
jgi:D-3-phosphoglycerate dehydrogenase / 2-oxoglutarate reductase